MGKVVKKRRRPISGHLLTREVSSVKRL